MIENNFGFVRLAVASPSLILGQTKKNAQTILSLVREAESKKIATLVFPHLSLTGLSLGDLLFQDSLLDASREMLLWIAKETLGCPVLFSLGLPFFFENRFYSVQAWLHSGTILALIPSSADSHFFRSSNRLSPAKRIFLSEDHPAIPFSPDIIIQDSALPFFSLASITEDAIYAPFSPALLASKNGARIIAHHASDKSLVGKRTEKELFLKVLSKQGNFACLSAAAPPSESTSAFVYSAHNLILERGRLLRESFLQENKIISCEIDLDLLAREEARKKRLENRAFHFAEEGRDSYEIIRHPILKDVSIGILERSIKKDVFIPELVDKKARYDAIFQTQVLALVKRLKHISCEKMILGLSGGLDSCLAFIVAVKTCRYLGLDAKNILAISMPGFGTTSKTKTNAEKLASAYGASFLEISIEKAVRQHFLDIGHDSTVENVVFENAQARERTQILMDLANKESALLLGTGNMSELALGWTTYNGDHMSMYALNSGIPKTLVKDLVQFEADEILKIAKTAEKEDDAEAKKYMERAQVLAAVLDTPISPELLSPVSGAIAQKTESLIGPYILHDFFMYYLLRFGFSPKKIFFLAEQAFIFQEKEPLFNKKEILSWLRVFYSRFFSQQFKRSCAPDYVSIGSLAFSSSSWSMPSDAVADIWLAELDDLEKNVDKALQK